MLGMRHSWWWYKIKYSDVLDNPSGLQRFSYSDYGQKNTDLLNTFFKEGFFLKFFN